MIARLSAVTLIRPLQALMSAQDSSSSEQGACQHPLTAPWQLLLLSPPLPASCCLLTSLTPPALFSALPLLSLPLAPLQCSPVSWEALTLRTQLGEELALLPLSGEWPAELKL